MSPILGLKVSGRSFHFYCIFEALDRTIVDNSRIIFLFLNKTICCDPLFKPSQRDGSDDGSQYMFLCRNNQNYP